MKQTQWQETEFKLCFKMKSTKLYSKKLFRKQFYFLNLHFIWLCVSWRPKLFMTRNGHKMAICLLQVFGNSLYTTIMQFSFFFSSPRSDFHARFCGYKICTSYELLAAATFFSKISKWKKKKFFLFPIFHFLLWLTLFKTRKIFRKIYWKNSLVLSNSLDKLKPNT